MTKKIAHKAIIYVNGEKLDFEAGTPVVEMQDTVDKMVGPSEITASFSGKFRFTGPLKKYPYKGKKRIREKYKKRFCKIFGLPYMYPNKRNTKKVNDFIESVLPSEPPSGSHLDGIGEMYAIKRCPDESDESYRLRILGSIRGEV